MDIENIIETFEFFDDWEDRYRYLIELGRDLEGLDESDKTEANRVQGCVSNVWMVTTVLDGSPVQLEFRADSDAHIVRGLVAILLSVYSGRSPDQILCRGHPGAVRRARSRLAPEPEPQQRLLLHGRAHKGHRPELHAGRPRGLTRLRTEEDCRPPAPRATAARLSPPLQRRSV